MFLVEGSKSDHELQARLRDVLNMNRDAEKWKNLCRMLQSKVVYEDRVPRSWLLPAAASMTGKSIGLLYKVNKGQVEFGQPLGKSHVPELCLSVVCWTVHTQLHLTVQTHLCGMCAVLRLVLTRY